MKKQTLLTLALVGLGLAVMYRTFQPRKVVMLPEDGGVHTEASRAGVTVTIDDGTGVATYSATGAATAFDALRQAADIRKAPVATKTYDFGIFVDAVGDKKSSADRAWIYSVNGISGTVAADKQTVKPGDSVEWRYTVPTTQ